MARPPRRWRWHLQGFEFALSHCGWGTIRMYGRGEDQPSG